MTDWVMLIRQFINMKKSILTFLATIAMSAQIWADKLPVDYVNPFIGTTNFGTCNPGAVCPQGLMSVAPFNVMGSDENKYDKDSRWWSTPYDVTNSFLTGFAHVNLSGVGCPEASSLLVMPTTGKLDVDYRNYGSKYKDEVSIPGYYTATIDKYGVKAELTATLRTSIERYTFPKGESHILLNLGEGLTNESGATMRFVGDREIEGTKLLGTFCYVPQSVFPIYFVMRLSKTPKKSGYWKKQRPMTAEAEWDDTAGKYKLYNAYRRDISGDDIGAWFDFDTEEGEQIEVRMGVSFTSIANARENLDKEQADLSFDTARENARNEWNKNLSAIEVEGGTEEQKTIFYTAFYHLLIHPNILQDVNGDYPLIENAGIGRTTRNRYTVFSLWDTYRNVHQMMTLLFPDRQMDMIDTFINMYKEWGWLPKWELFGRETMTMEGDPALPVIVDTWMKGFRDFDVETAYEAMVKSATTQGKDNPIRPDIDEYLKRGYCPMESQYDNSVSHALEYYVADYALSTFARALGKKDDAERFYKQSMGYKNYYSKEYGTLRPITQEGSFYEPFDPKQGENFEPSPGFHEGNAWNYTFYVPHDVKGMVKLMGGRKKFIERLQSVFDNKYYDPANEPDIAYPYLFSYFKGEEWRTQKIVKQLLADNFHNKPWGIPGNDDTGTMSCWAMFSMIGLYPDCPGVPEYTLTTPTFSKVTIHLDPRYYGSDRLVIETSGKGDYIKDVTINGKRQDSMRINHKAIAGGGTIKFRLSENH